MRAVAPWPEGGLERVAACPACGSPRREVLHEGLVAADFHDTPGSWTFHRCLGCRAAYLDPRPSPGTLGQAYRDYFTHAPPAADAGGGSSLRDRLRNGHLNARYGYRFTPSSWLGPAVLALLPVRRRRAERRVRHVPRVEGGRLLDVGCGNGTFLLQMRPQGWQVAGVDADPGAVASARGAGLEVAQGDVCDAPLPPGSFDLVTLSHVLEHLPDPVRALRACRRLLRPGGTLWVETPNLDCLGHRRLGRVWGALEPPRHLVLFTQGSLRTCLERAGFPGARLLAGLGAYGSSRVGREVRTRGEGKAFPASSLADRLADELDDLAGVLRTDWSANLVAVARADGEGA
jgi:SAM-dependent methyltransferase